MNLIWVTSTRHSTLVIPGLVDYAGQPLKFTSPGTPLARRCVRRETLDNELLQRYIRSGMLAVVDSEGAVQSIPAVAAPVAAPVVVAPPVVVVEPEPAPVEAEAPADADTAEAAVPSEAESTDAPAEATSSNGNKKKKR